MMKNKFLAILAVGVLAAGQSANAVVVLDQSNEAAETGYLTVAIGYFQQQTFTVGIAGQLSRLDVYVYREAEATEDLFVGLYSTSGGSPTSLIGGTSFLASQVAAAGWLSIDVDYLSLMVNPGDLFAIGLSSNAANDPPYSERYGWSVSDDVYAAGESYLNGAPYFEYDKWFRTYVDVVQVPEPGTLALFGLGLAGLGFSRRKLN